MPFCRRAVLSGLAMFGAVALTAAADDIMQKAVNEPGAFWTTWGKAKTAYVADSGVKGGAAERVTISAKPNNPWDVGASSSVAKAVRKGDVVLLMFWARAEKSPPGSDLVIITGRVYENAPPGTAVTPETNYLVGKQWKLYYSSGKATKDYPVGTLSAGMILGTGEQVIDLGPMFVLDLGPSFNVYWLPHS
jgi:hypothetical protein